MDHVLNTDEMAWKPFTHDTLKGYELKPNVIGSEYTDAYSMDVVRVAPGGWSASHVDQARHAFYILSGMGRVTVGGQTYEVVAGSIVKIPPGVPHAVNNESDTSLVFLTMYDPPRKRN